jgi:hypothetical protein
MRAAIFPDPSVRNGSTIFAWRGGWGYYQDRDVRKLIERRRSDLERVGVLTIVSDAPYDTAGSIETGNGGLAPGYWLNFKQAMLVAMWSETEEVVASEP